MQQEQLRNQLRESFKKLTTYAEFQDMLNILREQVEYSRDQLENVLPSDPKIYYWQARIAILRDILDMPANVAASTKK